MPRPKCTEFVGVKLPYELDCALQSEADRRTVTARRMDPASRPVTKSDVIKDCCEFRLSLTKALRLGFYTLHALPDEGPGELGLTMVGKV